MSEGVNVGGIFAIDPGPEFSAGVLLSSQDERVVFAEKLPNDRMLALLRRARAYAEGDPYHADLLGGPASYVLAGVTIAIEMIASYGMPVGAEVFETCVVIGRFIGVLDGEFGEPVRVKRLDVKSHLCHSGKANDANIRQAIIDRYGGKERAIGRKATPGPLYGVSGDCWAALAVALVVRDRMQGRAVA